MRRVAPFTVDGLVMLPGAANRRGAHGDHCARNPCAVSPAGSGARRSPTSAPRVLTRRHRAWVDARINL